MNIKITKREKLKEVNNEMCHNYYYLIHGRIINDDDTMYKKFKFVLWFDAFDIQEFYEIDSYTKADITNYINELIYSYTELINSYDDTSYFYQICNESIENYNK